MTSLLRYLHLASLALWVGGIVYFSFFVAPPIFMSYPRPDSGMIMGTLFPAYYRFHGLCAVVALATGFLLARGGEGRVKARFGVVVVLAALAVYQGLILGPEVREIRMARNFNTDPGRADELNAAFARTHRCSTRLNGTMLLLGFVALGLAAGRDDEDYG